MIDEFVELCQLNLVQKCSDNLEAFNGVAAKFRMSKKDMPTKISNFTGSIYRPLEKFIHDFKITDKIKLQLQQAIA